MRSYGPVGGPLADILTPYTQLDRTPRSSPCWVMSNMVIGLDGSASMGGRVGALSTGRDAELFLRLRGLADVVLVGAETARRERYGPVQLAPDLAALREQRGVPEPRVAVISRSLDLPPDLPLFGVVDGREPPLVFTCGAHGGAVANIAAEVVVAGDDHVDLRVVMNELARRSAGVVLCEGGPRLLGEMIGDGLLDEYCLTVAPVIGGDQLQPVVTTMMSGLEHFELINVVEDVSTLFLHYVRKGVAHVDQV